MLPRYSESYITNLRYYWSRRGCEALRSAVAGAVTLAFAAAWAPPAYGLSSGAELIAGAVSAVGSVGLVLMVLVVNVMIIGGLVSLAHWATGPSRRARR